MALPNELNDPIFTEMQKIIDKSIPVQAFYIDNETFNKYYAALPNLTIMLYPRIAFYKGQVLIELSPPGPEGEEE